MRAAVLVALMSFGCDGEAGRAMAQDVVIAETDAADAVGAAEPGIGDASAPPDSAADVGAELDSATDASAPDEGAGAADAGAADVGAELDSADDASAPDVSAGADADTAPDVGAALDSAPDEGAGADSASDTASHLDSAASDGVPEAAVDTGPGICPTPPYGTAVGDTLADYTLYACDGSPVALASVCQSPVSLVSTFAGWCPSCNTHAGSAPSDYAKLQTISSGSAWLFVITEDNNGSVPSLAYCAAVRDRFGLPMTVLVDLAGGLPAHLGVASTNAWYLVLSAGLRIELKVKYNKDWALGVALQLAE